jgi:hypothetical protein
MSRATADVDAPLVLAFTVHATLALFASRTFHPCPSQLEIPEMDRDFTLQHVVQVGALCMAFANLSHTRAARRSKNDVSRRLRISMA